MHLASIFSASYICALPFGQPNACKCPSTKHYLIHTAPCQRWFWSTKWNFKTLHGSKKCDRPRERCCGFLFLLIIFLCLSTLLPPKLECPIVFISTHCCNLCYRLRGAQNPKPPSKECIVRFSSHHSDTEESKQVVACIAGQVNLQLRNRPSGVIVSAWCNNTALSAVWNPPIPK